MKPSLTLAAVAAFFALAACNGGSTSASDAANEAAANAAAEAKATPMPPMIKENKIYRCKDNSVVYVDFMNDDMTVNLRTAKDGLPTVLKAPAAGEPFVSGETTLTGKGASITLARPGKPSQSCKA